VLVGGEKGHVHSIIKTSNIVVIKAHDFKDRGRGASMAIVGVGFSPLTQNVTCLRIEVVEAIETYTYGRHEHEGVRQQLSLAHKNLLAPVGSS
jgi:hypothetical protein